MSLYNVINGVLFKRSVTPEEVEEFHVPFMMNRWYSMHSVDQAQIANILNQYGQVFTDKHESFRFFNTIIPKLNYKKIDYIKKSKEKKEIVNENIPVLARSLELSEREVKSILELIDTYAG